MAYGLKYTISFKNRRQNDVYRAEVWERDFIDDPIELTGADTPFTAAYQGSDDDLFNPIKGLEINLSFLTQDDISLFDFYTEDEEKYRIDFYCQELADATSIEQLLFTGYVLQLGSQEAVTDRKHVITLKATDNLGLMKEITLDVAMGDVVGKKSLWDILGKCLEQTGLYSDHSAIDKSLHLRVYDNLFENSTDDRSILDTNDPLRETFVHTGMFENSDGTWMNCYDVTAKILQDKNACIFQAEGFWNIIRNPEYKLFTDLFVDGLIPGTDYNYNAGVTDITAVTLDPFVQIDKDGTIAPITEDQLNSIQRPLKYVKNTFNYQQPKSLIKNSDLQLPIGATPYDTTTVGDLQYDKYSIATYFPNWIQTHSDTSYLMVVTNTVLATEVERYIVTPGATDEQRGIQFNYIEVTARDSFDFSLKFRTPSDEAGIMYFWIRFILVTESQYYLLANIPETGSSINVHWNGPYSIAGWDTALGIYKQVPANDNSSEDHTWSLSSMVEQGGKLPLLPEDGILLIEVRATNGTNGLTRTDMYWKDITLDFTNYINESTKIIGQTHNDSLAPLIKNKLEQDLSMDDSPRNTIAGTLFTDQITNFDADIGNVLFTKTALWHRGAVSEALRLGNIITQERLNAEYCARTVIEGTFKNLRYTKDSTTRFVSMLTLFEILLGSLVFDGGRRFIFSIVTFDYMACTFTGKPIEIFKGGEFDFIDTYTFNYLYEVT